MATVKFYLKSANKQNLFPVLMCYQSKGKKFRFFTKVYVQKSKWQSNYLKPLNLADFKDKEKLDSCKDLIEVIEKQGLTNQLLYSVEEVEMKFREKILTMPGYEEVLNLVQAEKCSKDEESEFFTHFEEFIEHSKATKTKSTIDHYKNCKIIIK